MSVRFLQLTRSLMVSNQVPIIFLLSVLSIFFLSQASDTIPANQSLKDGDTIVSANGDFELGFFQIGKPNNRYVGIWYSKIPVRTIVWVANRDNPLTDSTGKLILSGNGTLHLVNSRDLVVWSSSGSTQTGLDNPVAQILGTGNFVVKTDGDDDSESEDYLWQSFDHPGDTFLPGMKYGMDFLTGNNRFLTSWLSPDNPSTGNYTNELDRDGVPQFFLKKDSVDVFRAGPWNGLRYSGMPYLKPNSVYTYQFVFTDQEAYYTYKQINSSVTTRMQLTPYGKLERYIWIDRSKSWNLYLSAQMDNCDRYRLCGSYGICNINNNPSCGCLKGFVPRFSDEWVAGDWSQGCVRETDLTCGVDEDFLKISGVKLPDTRKSWFSKSMDLTECRKMCFNKCSCVAYANFDIRNGGTGCIIWFDVLTDIRQYTENGQDIYLRLAISDIEIYNGSGRKKRLVKILVPTLTVGLFLLGLCILMIFLRRKKKLEREEFLQGGFEQVSGRKRDEEDFELPLLDFDKIVEATDDFSEINKLGKGGFGTVYKGVLEDGQEIAVKRLSRTSRQGLEEFKNEISVMAKLQHRNLVKIIGCCVQDNERIIVYEYLPNRSLDSFIFDEERREELDWSKRLNIINGIARGLLYLHQDSRLRIIHRDLKASNVLLDSDMNPKISDFGMARTFGGDETEANTTRVVGTYGYMSPEYQIDGFFSVKSDVFSFGVLVLEILTGKRNRGFCSPEHKLNLLGHTWRLCKEGRGEELMEKQEKGSSCNEMMWRVLRVVTIGLLCVQQNPEDRPNMSTVVMMLSSDNILPEPKEPGFFTDRNLLFSDSTSLNHLQETPSNNFLTMSMVLPR